MTPLCLSEVIEPGAVTCRESHGIGYDHADGWALFEARGVVVLANIHLYARPDFAEVLDALETTS